MHLPAFFWRRAARARLLGFLLRTAAPRADALFCHSYYSAQPIKSKVAVVLRNLGNLTIFSGHYAQIRPAPPSCQREFLAIAAARRYHGNEMR